MHDRVAPGVPRGHHRPDLGSTDWRATRLFATPFAAPLEEWRLGARWVRCDVYLPEHGLDSYRNGNALHAPVALDPDTLAAWRTCLSYVPDDAGTIDCAELHSYESIWPTLDVSDLGDERPGDEELSAAAEEEHCTPVVTEYLGGSPPETILSWDHPAEKQWDAGDRVIICGAEVDGGQVEGTLQGGGDEVVVVPFDEG